MYLIFLLGTTGTTRMQTTPGVARSRQQSQAASGAASSRQESPAVVMMKRYSVSVEFRYVYICTCVHQISGKGQQKEGNTTYCSSHACTYTACIASCMCVGICNICMTNTLLPLLNTYVPVQLRKMLLRIKLFQSFHLCNFMSIKICQFFFC